ncbi:PREDICTED: beta-defensin 119-like [Ceratotherium simum simum]|uniref:Beta-defensin n=1 Tax=Ceratotherium simum simum TaxID=73337 RepID=A0ABM1DKF9_CERSS|nr:PREDICTED: beta-defensin 119-like [Ceratotherium simum simum]
MKFLFLFLAILLAMEPVVSADCWMNGQCRLVCKNDEDSVTRCSNRKRCCVPSRYLTIQPVTIDGELPWTTPHVTKHGARQ